MGWDIWIQGFIWVFFLYGLLIFIRMFFYRPPRVKKKVSTLVIVVQNGEEYIEGLLRSLAVQGFDIDVMDKNSTDATRGIVEKLSQDLDNIHFIEEDFCKVEGDLVRDIPG